MYLPEHAGLLYARAVVLVGAYTAVEAANDRHVGLHVPAKRLGTVERRPTVLASANIRSNAASTVEALVNTLPPNEGPLHPNIVVVCVDLRCLVVIGVVYANVSTLIEAKVGIYPDHGSQIGVIDEVALLPVVPIAEERVRRYVGFVVVVAELGPGVSEVGNVVVYVCRVSVFVNAEGSSRVVIPTADLSLIIRLEFWWHFVFALIHEAINHHVNALD
mmetsp:Transcript_2193/g.4475  ORF Transcript_2193/g.4475 Transcript_2193/m.4475 type:complete len:218 (-) Transcript_2193:5421-6074(-)